MVIAAGATFSFGTVLAVAAHCAVAWHVGMDDINGKPIAEQVRTIIEWYDASARSAHREFGRGDEGGMAWSTFAEQDIRTMVCDRWEDHADPMAVAEAIRQLEARALGVAPPDDDGSAVT